MHRDYVDITSNALSTSFLSRVSMPAQRDIDMVHPSVCPSHSGIVSKRRMHISPNFFFRLVDASAASISYFQFRYDIDTIFTKYHDIDIDIN